LHRRIVTAGIALLGVAALSGLAVAAANTVSTTPEPASVSHRPHSKAPAGSGTAVVTSPGGGGTTTTDGVRGHGVVGGQIGVAPSSTTATSIDDHGGGGGGGGGVTTTTGVDNHGGGSATTTVTVDNSGRGSSTTVPGTSGTTPDGKGSGKGGGGGPGHG